MNVPTIDVHALDSLDFTPALPCEHSQHEERHDDQPAKYFVQGTCPECTHAFRGLLRQSGWRRLMGMPAIKCNGWGASFPGRGALTIIEVLT